MLIHSDTDLMIRTQQGDLHCMGMLYNKHKPHIVNYLKHRGATVADAEDLAQETFWRMLRYRDSYKPHHSFRAWMYKIARNCHTDFHRKSAHKLHTQPEENTSWEPEAPEDTLNTVKTNDDKVILKQALNALPEDKRELLILARFQQLSHREISKLIGCREDTVKVRIHRALQELRTLFEEFSERKMA